MEVLGGILVLFLVGIVLFSVALSAVMLWALWKMFIKLGEPGWVGIIPVYNMFKLAEHTFGNGWTFLINFNPVVGMPYFMYKVFKCFGAEDFPAIVLAILAPIGLMVYGFNKATWLMPVDASQTV